MESQPNEVGTTPQCFYGLPSLHLWTFFKPLLVELAIAMWHGVTGCYSLILYLRCGFAFFEVVLYYDLNCKWIEYTLG